MTATWTNATNLLPEPVRLRLRTGSGAQIAANMVWLVFDKIYATAIAFVVNIFVARYLGRGAFGLLSYTLAFVTLFRMVGNLGIEEVLVRELVRFPDQRHEILGTAVSLRAISGTVVIGLVALFVQFARPHDPTARFLVIITSLLYIPQSMMVFQHWNTARILAKYNVLASNAALTLISVARLLLVFFHASLLWFVWANVGLIFFQTLMLMLIYVATGESLTRWRPRWHWARQMIRDAWPRIPDGIASSVLGQIGALLIGSMLGDDRLGPYAIAFRFYALLLVVPDILCQSLASTLTKAHENGPELFRRRLVQTYRLLLGLYVAILAPIFILGLWGVQLLYGAQYAEAGRLVIYMSLPLLLIYLNQVRVWYIIIENRFQYAMYISFVQLAVTLLANVLLIRRIGPAGAVLAMAIGAASVICCDAVFRPARGNAAAIWQALTFTHPAKVRAPHRSG